MPPPSGSTRRIGIIAEATAAHLDHYLESIAACVDLGPLAFSDPAGASSEQARRLLPGILTFASPNEMLATFQPELVIVLAEAAHGAQWIAAARRAGCDVLSEKHPIARPDQFEALFADQNGTRLMLAFSSRINPAVVKARTVLASLGGFMAAQMYAVADQTRLRDETYRQSWRCDPARAGGGILMAIGIHQIDLLLHLTGLSVRRVSAICVNVGGEPVKIEDAAVLAIELSNGAVATTHVGFYLDAAYQGTIHFWMANGWLTLNPVECSLAWQHHDAPRPEHWSADCAHQTRDFLQAVFNGHPVADNGFHVLQTVFAAYESSASGQTVVIH